MVSYFSSESFRRRDSIESVQYIDGLDDDSIDTAAAGAGEGGLMLLDETERNRYPLPLNDGDPFISNGGSISLKAAANSNRKLS